MPRVFPKASATRCIYSATSRSGVQIKKRKKNERDAARSSPLRNSCSKIMRETYRSNTNIARAYILMARARVVRGIGALIRNTKPIFKADVVLLLNRTWRLHNVYGLIGEATIVEQPAVRSKLALKILQLRACVTYRAVGTNLLFRCRTQVIEMSMLFVKVITQHLLKTCAGRVLCKSLIISPFSCS